MAVQFIAKAVEAVSKVSEKGIQRPKVREFAESEKKLPNPEKPCNKIEVLKAGRPPVDVIKTASLQQLIEENKSKINDIRKALVENTENSDENDNTPDGNEETDKSDKNVEDKELSEEINKQQNKAIKEAMERIRTGEKFTNEELGNLGEMMMDQYYISKGYKPLNKHRVTSLDDKKSGFKTGIDGVYEKNNSDGTKSYIVADAKYNTSKLSDTNDGKQMSDNWINKRLDASVGKEKADEIRDVAEDDPNLVRHEIYHIAPNIDENSNMHTDIQEVDSEGNKAGEKTVVEYFDKDGNRIEPSEED